MFIKRTKRSLRGKTYTNHLLVESVATERGPRHRVICSLGSLGPAPRARWLKLAHDLQESLGGQESFLERSAQEHALAQKASLAAKGKKRFRALRFNSRRSGGANTILPKLTPSTVAHNL